MQESSKENFKGLASLRECPFCKGKLENGYLLAPRGANWDTKKHKIMTFPAEGVISKLSFGIPTVSGLRCTNCRVIIFHYEK